MFLRCSIGITKIPVHVETKGKLSFLTFYGKFQLWHLLWGTYQKRKKKQGILTWKWRSLDLWCLPFRVPLILPDNPVPFASEDPSTSVVLNVGQRPLILLISVPTNGEEWYENQQLRNTLQSCSKFPTSVLPGWPWMLFLFVFSKSSLAFRAS